jgi:hypothetical protein
MMPGHAGDEAAGQRLGAQFRVPTRPGTPITAGHEPRPTFGTSQAELCEQYRGAAVSDEELLRYMVRQADIDAIPGPLCTLFP